VTYYFSDKAELLLEAFGTFKIQGAHGFRTRYERDPADLLGHLTAITALDEGRLDITRCFHAFRAKALRDGPFRDEERRYSVRCKGYIEAFVKAARPCSADPERAARRLMSIVEGISSQSVIDPGSWSRADIRGEFAAAIDALPHRRG
jgi:AcrR family transcriptional regulator